MLHRLVNIVFNPFSQALVVALAIILFVPQGLNKYQATPLDQLTLFEQNQFTYADLDHDGYSEQIMTFYNKSGNVALYLRVSYATLGQWNFKGGFNKNSPRLMIGDYNYNDLDEIYLFTLVADSVMLHILEYGKFPRLILTNRFICKLGKNLKDPDYEIIPGHVSEMTGDSVRDLVFAISAGFSLQPRKVFLYDIFKDSLHESPESGAYINNISLLDLNKDNLPEVLISTYASDNYNESPYPFTDTSAWFMVLDHKLQFLFHPIEFQHPTGTLELAPIKNDFNELIILGKYSHVSPLKFPGQIFISDLTGKILKNKEIWPGSDLFNLRLTGSSNESIKAIGSSPDFGFFTIDGSLNIDRPYKTDLEIKNVFLFDTDNDSKDEIIYISKTPHQYCILRNDYSHPVFLDLPLQSSKPIFSVKLNGPNPPQLSVQGDQVWKLYDYGINPMWKLRFLIWAGIYGVILIFILVIRKLYSFQLKKRYETEKKIARLQLASVKAQMEPHFIMNTINTIGSSIYRQKPDEAYQHLVNFSGMVRSLLVSSDKLTRTLEEEIEFVKNYLELEKSRFEGAFEYSFNIAENIDQECLIPKMIIQLHTENALKHGLLPKKSGGVLEIEIASEADYFVISIKDNGIGRSAAAKAQTSSTGKGMKIMEQLFETYNRHNALHLKQEIIDLTDVSGIQTGTYVRIWIPFNLNPEVY